MGTLQQTLQGTQTAGAGNREYFYQEKVAQTVIAQIVTYYSGDTTISAYVDGCNLYLADDTNLIVEVPGAPLQTDEDNFGPVYLSVSGRSNVPAPGRLDPLASATFLQRYNAHHGTNLDYHNCLVLLVTDSNQLQFSAIISGTLAPKKVELTLPLTSAKPTAAK